MTTANAVSPARSRFLYVGGTRTAPASSDVLTHQEHALTQPTTDANDESLQKWKASLGLGTGDNLSDPNDPRKVIIFSLGLEVEGRSDIIIDLTQPGQLEDLNKKPFTIKEGASFRMKARFKVQHQILSGMKYVQVVSRMGVKNKMQEMIVCIRLDLRSLTSANTCLGIVFAEYVR